MERTRVITRRTDLSPEQRALFEKRLRGEVRGGRMHAVRISKRTDQSIAPLSLAQEGQWLLEQLIPGNTIFTIFQALRIAEAIDLDALQRSLVAVVNRHDILRTNFRLVGDAPAQVIHPPRPLQIPLVDFSHLTTEEAEAAAVAWTQKALQRPFDLATGQLLRVYALSLGPADFVVVINLHHIICDAWSLGILYREFLSAYKYTRQGEAPPWQRLPLQYGDFAAWQRSHLHGEAIGRQLAFWQTYLAGAPPTLALPFDRPRTAKMSFEGGKRNLRLKTELTSRLRALCQKERVTLYMVAAAMLAALFHRYSGGTDIVLGSPIANRSSRELEPLIGLFMNTVAMRINLAGNPTIRELLARVRETSLQVFDNQDVPFERILERINVRRDQSHTPVFQVLLAFQPPRTTSAIGESPTNYFSGTVAGSKFDQTWTLIETENGEVSGNVQYATDLFDDATVARMAQQFTRLLECAATDPTLQMSELPMLAATEHQALIAAVRANRVPYSEKCVHELFAEQARRTPDAVALRAGDWCCSYRSLDEHTNRLARQLRSLGAGPETRVGLALGPTPQAVLALIAILKTGAAYLPLDLGYPSDRLAFMLSNAQASLVVTDAPGAGRFAASGVAVFRIDTGWQDAGRHRAAALPTLAVPQSAAYVLYTSGSTGQPKAVVGTHAALTNRLTWDIGVAGAGDSYAMKTTINFIDVLWEIFMPLLRGQSLTIVPETDRKNPELLLDQLARGQVTRIVLVPSLLDMLLGIPGIAEKAPLLRYWACSGEKLPVELVQRFRAALPHAALINVYGTSEFWDATAFDLSADAADGEVPIGTALPNMDVLVLDSAMQPTAAGVTGTLHTGGAGLARGYFAQPALTAQRFVPDPFGTGERLYWSGDLARRTRDGMLLFAGRRDQQVKLFGHRIELAEVEAALETHPDVTQAVVMVRDDVPGGGDDLVGYVLSPAAPDAATLRAHLVKRLPRYMIPGYFVVLDALPLTPNGKLDRRALPATRLAGPAAIGPAGAANSTEATLVALWRQTLGLQDIGIDDNFFELGGDSLMLARVAGALVDQFRCDVPVTMLFRYPTIRSLAAALATVAGTAHADAGAEADQVTRMRERTEMRRRAAMGRQRQA